MSKKQKRVAYYVSAHGYGHGVRSCDMIRAILKKQSVDIVLISVLPHAFLANRLGWASVEFREGKFDVGMVQKDSIRVDLDATLRELQELSARWDDLVDTEAAWLREQDARLIVCDIPAIPVAAAKRIGIPAVVVANFSWDWIYDEFAERDVRWRHIVERFASAYGQTDLLLKLPFSPEMGVFPKKIDIPLVASPGRARRADIARITGADISMPWVLLSFTTLEWKEDALSRVESLKQYEFFTVQPLEWHRRNIHAVNRDVIPFSDVLASVDVVVSKPGFGLLSECVVNRKPLVYADRTDFREYAVLEREMKRFLRCVHIPTDALYRGELETALAAVTAQPDPPETLSADGGDKAATILLNMM